MPIRPFGSVCHLVNGKAFKPTDWAAAGVPIIRIQNLNGSDKPFNYWAGALDKQVLVKTGDLLLAWSGTPGTSFGAHIWNGPNGILNQHIFRCDLDEKTISKQWARIAVNHRLDRLIEQAHGGVGLQHVTRGMVEELEIPLPPLEEQRRIAEVLDRAEALRAKRRAALAQLDSLTQSIFLGLFGDPKIPERRIGDLLESGVLLFHKDGNHGSLYPRADDFGEEGVPFLSARTISDEGLIDNALIEKLRLEKAVKLRIGWISKGDVLLAHNASVGKVALYDGRFEKALIGTSLTAFRPHPEMLDSHYLAAAFRSVKFQSELAKNMGQTTRNQVPISAQRELRVGLPPIELQREFARRASAVEKLKQSQRASLAELDALFASLQQCAFTGKL